VERGLRGDASLGGGDIKDVSQPPAIRPVMTAWDAVVVSP